MNLFWFCKHLFVASGVGILLGAVVYGADPPKKAPAPAPKAPSAAAKGAPAAGHGPATATHGPTTAAHGPTTAAHGPTTATHSPTTANRGAATTGHAPTANASNASARPSANTPGHVSSAPGGVGKKSATSQGRVPNGSTTAPTRNGGTVTRRADGKVAVVHDPQRGMEIHRGLNGNRRVVVERGDHSRVVVDQRGRGYVQRPYMYHGHEYAARTYYANGRSYNVYYGRYYYGGVYINPYMPAYYYPPAYYGWVYNPWAAPVYYSWGWGGNPWYGYYGTYFTPYSVYPSAAFWLTDYIVSASLAASYQAQVAAQTQAQIAAMNNPAPLSPDVKQLISDEVKRQIALENAESQTAAHNGEIDPASSSIQRMLSDGVPHVFVAGHDLDTVDASGAECVVSEGDALQLAGQSANDAATVNLTVLASKGGRECPKGDVVSIGLQDLQDMQNHMRETIGQGMQELQAKQGQGGIPAAPPSAKAPPVPNAIGASAPPPDPNVAAEIDAQARNADQAEQEASSEGSPVVPASAPPAVAPPAPVGPPPTVTLNQTPEQVTAILGQPQSIVDLGAKKIYRYKDMKVTFYNGKVTAVE